MERMVPWCRHPIVVAQWIHHTSSVPWRMVRTPGGIEMHRTTRTPFWGARERERETERERERVEHGGKGTERCNRRERAGESKREWEGERRGETHRARDRG